MLDNLGKDCCEEGENADQWVAVYFLLRGPTEFSGRYALVIMFRIAVLTMEVNCGGCGLQTVLE